MQIPGDELRDSTNRLQLEMIPTESFFVGSRTSEPDSLNNELPRHKATLQSFAIGQYEVTFDEWNACLAACGYDHKPDDKGWGCGARPVINVSWEDAQQYAAWLSVETGETYRLPSEAEWEYAARAFPTSNGSNPPAFAFGDSITMEQANFNRHIGKTVEVGNYPASDWGLHDVHGNVWEWIEDAWHDTYDDAPTDGRSWLGGDDSLRVLRGGSWFSYPVNLRSANRFKTIPDNRSYYIGFRVSRTLAP